MFFVVFCYVDNNFEPDFDRDKDIPSFFLIHQKLKLVKEVFFSTLKTSVA